MSESETGRFDDEHFGDPSLEMMNNFYAHLPGKYYRPDKESKGLSKYFFEILQEHKRWFDEPKETWPEDEVNEIEASKMKYLIQAEIDKFFEQKPKLAGWWEDWKLKYPYEMTQTARQAIENQIIRPVYVALRGKFSQDQLIV
jgi:hypothetical protein